MSKKKIFLYSLLGVVLSGMLYLYIWEKPKWEAFWKKRIENLVNRHVDQIELKIGRLNISIIPLQAEFYNAHIKLKKGLQKYADPFEVKKIAVRPSMLDIIIGKVWLSSISIDGAEIVANIPEPKESAPEKKKKLNIDISEHLKSIPLSQLNVQNIKLNLNIGKKYGITADSLYIKAYNEKSSLILTIKDPNMGVRTSEKANPLHFITDFQMMLTKNTLSLSKIKLIKDTSFFLASGNMLFNGSPEDMTELNIRTRLSSNFADLKKWSNQVHKNTHFDLLKGEIKTDIQIIKKAKNKPVVAELSGALEKLQVGKIKLGKIEVEADLPSKDQINIPKITAVLPGDNKIQITDAKVHLGKKIELKADVDVKNAQLQTFLRDSGIADIPVWLRVTGQMKCAGGYEKTLRVECPGALTIKNVKIKNASRSKTIVAAKKADIGGTMIVTEKNITYTAQAKMEETRGESSGIIDYDKGFDIKYNSEFLDLSEIGKIGELEFLGTGTAKGSTQGDSRSAIFDIDIKAKNFEFEKYFFGDTKAKLNYKAGTLFFNNLDGNIESTRYSGNLQVNLIKEMITGDIQLPFFRMEDVQQSVLKKVDLQNRFLGSGSGRLKLNSPFKVSQMNFNLDARLFKGSAFAEEYNEARIKAEAVDGIIILQEVKLQKEKTQFLMKGTLDTDLQSQLTFIVNDGLLHLSSRLKAFSLPLSGQFNAKGSIDGPLNSPVIKTSAKVKNLIFNKKKYGEALFSYDNSKKQTNIQFNIPEHLDFLVIFPESNFETLFIDTNATNLDIAPMIGFLVSEDATRNYTINTSGEISGNIDTRNFWASEFSSTVKNLIFDYKSNKLETTIPTNIELKNGRLFLNEISLTGNKQHIKVTQPYAEKFRTKFVINSRLNIAFFKLFAPFIEKIDGYSTLRLELSVNNKDIKLIGSSYTSDSFLKFPGFPHAFENVNADVLFNQNKVLINSISGELASGKVLGNGEVKFEGPKQFDLIINTSMENVSLHFPEGYKTSGSGNITLSGTGTPFLLSGTYNVESGLIDSNFGGSTGTTKTDLLEELLKKEITSPLVVNIDINALKPVEVRNTLVEGYITGNIKVFDKINTPRIKGEGQFAQNAIIRIQDQEFDVTESNFLFEGQTPINPKLYMRAETRMNNFDINMFLQGRAAKPLITWSSQPSLPESQILSMLALGTLPDQFNQDANQNLNGQNNSQGIEVGTNMLSNNPLGKELKERYDVDVQFSSTFDDQTSEAVPKFTLRKRITPKLQISGAATTGNNNQLEGRATYELNNNLSTIFFIKNRPDDNENLDGLVPSNQANPFGLDFNYRVEYD